MAESINTDLLLLYFSALQAQYIETIRKAENLRIEMDRLLLLVDTVNNYDVIEEATE